MNVMTLPFISCYQ